jgi:hypothetical protein
MLQRIAAEITYLGEYGNFARLHSTSWFPQPIITRYESSDRLPNCKGLQLRA